MNYLIASYIFIGACYATAAWITFDSDGPNKELMASFRKEGPITKGVVFLFMLIIAGMWPFLLVTSFFVSFFRHKASAPSGVPKQ